MRHKGVQWTFWHVTTPLKLEWSTIIHCFDIKLFNFLQNFKLYACSVLYSHEWVAWVELHKPIGDVGIVCGVDAHFWHWLSKCHLLDISKWCPELPRNVKLSGMRSVWIYQRRFELCQDIWPLWLCPVFSLRISLEHFSEDDIWVLLHVLPGEVAKLLSCHIQVSEVCGHRLYKVLLSIQYLLVSWILRCSLITHHRRVLASLQVVLNREINVSVDRDRHESFRWKLRISSGEERNRNFIFYCKIAADILLLYHAHELRIATLQCPIYVCAFHFYI